MVEHRQFMVFIAVVLIILVGCGDTTAPDRETLALTNPKKDALELITTTTTIPPTTTTVAPTTTIPPTTTTTSPPTTTTIPVPVPVTTERSNTNYGNSVWDTLAVCESGSNPPNWYINTGNGYYGGLQFDRSTWLDNGGGQYAEYAHMASRDQQIAIAEVVHSSRGFHPWPTCAAQLGLI